jgi:uncharacterized protein (TIGR02466 family)
MQSFLDAPQHTSPDNSRDQRVKGINHAMNGEFNRAIPQLEHALSLAPMDNLAKAYLGSCYYVLNKKQEAKRFLDTDEIFTDTVIHDEIYLNKLSSHIQNHPSLTWNPKHKATEGGFQSEELLHETSHLTTQLTKTLKTVFLNEFEMPLDHKNSPFKLVGWSVVLKKNGFQKPHIHRSGLLSGVIYLQVPRLIQPPEGSLLFTQHLPWLPTNKSHPTPLPKEELFIQPKAGQIVIFPSHFWHQTLPFNADQLRVSIAFDLTLK